ncbi:MAG TPA: AzlC family ABC transporter permease [Thermomicrobiales bacterium]|jgi:4-azaleucine resistance transporter AzlC
MSTTLHARTPTATPTPDAITFTPAGAAHGARLTLPLAASSLTYGLVFGVLARGVGLQLGEVALMSTLVFSGAVQLVAIGLWVTPLPIAGILVATLVVSLRHLLLGAALQPWFARLPVRRAYGSIFFLTDESWALATRHFSAGGRDAAFFLGSGLMMAVAWIVGCLLGRAGGAWLSDPARWGLDFAFTAVFVALLVGFWRGRGDLLPWGVAAIVALLAHRWLPGQWYIILGALAGSGAGAVRDAR